MAKEKETKKNIHEVVIKIEGEEWTKAMDAAFAKKQKTAKVDGFRKGKVPRNIYEKNFGKESLWLTAADVVLQDAYVKAMEESKLVPVVKPEINLKNVSDEGVEFTFKIITKPEIKVNKYKGLNIGTAKPTKEEMDGVKHHLIDVVAPTQSFSVSDYREQALPIVEKLLAQGKTPIICGGTGFYINSILFYHHNVNISRNGKKISVLGMLAGKK